MNRPDQRPRGLRPAAVGALAMFGALIFVYAVGVLVRGVPYPPARAGAVIAALFPGDAATAAIERLGHWAMRLLAVTVHAAAAGLGAYGASFAAKAGSPRAAARRALALGAGFGAAAGILGLSAPSGIEPIAFVAYGAAALFFARSVAPQGLGAALERTLREGEAPLDSIRRSRRRFVNRAIAGAGGLVVGGALTVRSRRGQSGGPAVAIAPAPKPFKLPPPDPAFPEVRGLTAEITANADFYTIDIDLIKPRVDHATWALEVGGLVDRPYRLGFAALQNSFEVVEMAHTLTCISNEVGGSLISTTVWRGVRLKDVMERAGLKAGVVDLVFHAADGYDDSIPLDKALEETTLVAFGMNGEALPTRHGFPARIVVPGIYGMKNVKWLTRIEAVAADHKGYWQRRGWSDPAPVKTSSRIDAPSRGDEVGASFVAGGLAWAGDRRIAAVEISEDEGATWRRAVLNRELSPVAWRQWAAQLGAEPAGRRRLLVRAVDGSGEVQQEKRAKPHPDGASGLDSVNFRSA